MTLRTPLALVLLLGSWAGARNPAIAEPRNADPSAHVWTDGRLYVYLTYGHDCWHVFSTDDLVHWADHDMHFGLSDTGWARQRAWAPDCAEVRNRYYFYYPAHAGDRPGMHTGVAVSDSPTGPFRDALGRPLLEHAHDPAVFQDDDGTCYLYAQTRVVRLGDDMISLAEAPRELTLRGHTLPARREAAFVFKRGGTTYWTCAEAFNTLTYWTGDSPYGPFTFRGKIMEPYGGNNHHSVVRFHGRWLLFYHRWGDDGRRTCIEFLHFNDDGSIRPVYPSDSGVEFNPALGRFGPMTRAGRTERPNILLLLADDWGRYAGVYRDPNRPSLSDVVRTPTLDRLGRRGLIFENAFTPAPSGSPCRGSLITGRYPWRLGRAANLGGVCFDGSPGLWEALPKYPAILETLGYRVGYSGKVGVDSWPGQERCFIRPEQRYVRHGKRFLNFSQEVTRALNAGASLVAAQQAVLDEVRLNFRDLLEDRASGEPFCYWFGPGNTHRDWVQGSGTALWGIDPNTLAGKLPADWPDVPVVRQDAADYLGEVQAFDAYVAVLLDELERVGELDHTLIVATGDNGVPGFPRAKRNLYDAGVRAPLMIAWGDTLQGGRRLEDFVNLMDLAPTFIEVAGGRPPVEMNGHSLYRVLLTGQGKTGRVDPTRDHVILGRERPTRHYPMRAIRTADYLYIRNGHQDDRPVLGDTRPDTLGRWYNLDRSPTRAWIAAHLDDPHVWDLFKLGFARRPDGELYDLHRDPCQLRNLAGDPAYAAIQGDLAERLQRVQVETGDSRALDEVPRCDRPPDTQP